MRKLTKREITLLYILVCMTIAVVGWLFVIQPASTKVLDKKAKLTEVEGNLASLQSDYTSFQTNVIPNIDAKIAETGELIKRFSTSLANEVIDKELTTIVRNYLMTPLDLKVVAQKREAIVSSSERAKLTAEGKELPKDDAGNPTGPQCDVIYVNLRVAGNLLNTGFLVNDINTREYMRVNALNIDEAKGIVTITVAIYVLPSEV